VGSLLTIGVNATDPDGDKLVYSATGLPANATFNGTNRTFLWKPVSGQAGNYTVSFSVSDGSLSDTKNAAITVKKIPGSGGSGSHAAVSGTGYYIKLE